LLPDVFWNMTWNDYHRACSGFHHRAELQWEQTRYLAALIFNANSKKSKTPQQLVPLNLDKKRKKQGGVTTQEDIARILEFHKTRLKPKDEQ
jgi:predicted amidophosphoribosyltransferase